MLQKQDKNQSIIVKNYPINGKGVFAIHTILSGEVVVYWEATREISQSELESLPLEERHYVDIQQDKILLVGMPERFVNHSCEANTRPGVRCDVATVIQFMRIFILLNQNTNMMIFPR